MCTIQIHTDVESYPSISCSVRKEDDPDPYLTHHISPD